jgi:hypothetical protein
MPKAKTIKVVEVEPIIDEPISEPISEPVNEPISEAISEPFVEVKLPKDANGAKAKRQPKAKKVEPIIEPEVTVESTLNESVVELKIPDELIKQLKVQADKVKCPDCEKMVTSKSLKYSHKYTCLSKKVQEHNDKTATKKEILLNENNDNNEDVTEYEPIVVALPIKPIVKETARDMRQRLRQERLLNLFVGAV